MNTSPELTEEELGYLRWYVAFHQRRGWRQQHGAIALLPLPLLLLALSYFLSHWLPGHLEAIGLALCRVHPTLHRGMVWLPTEPDLRQNLRVASSVTLLSAYGLGVLIAGIWVHDRRAQRIACILRRIHPEVCPDETIRSPTA